MVLVAEEKVGGEGGWGREVVFWCVFFFWKREARRFKREDEDWLG
jgi:hypothetical protein